MFLLELNNISADLELECVAVSSILPPVDLRTATMLLQISLCLFCHKIAGHYMCINFHVVALPPVNSCREDGRATD